MTNQPTVEILDVSPELAETWLSRNPNNRNLRKAVTEAYARDMAAGRWLVNGETIKFDTSGHLRDGQHRLNAVVLSQTTVSMVVIRGLSPDVMPTVDAGAKRTYSDALKLQGEDNTATLAAVTRRALMWERGARTRAVPSSPQASSDCATGCSATSNPTRPTGSSTASQTGTDSPPTTRSWPCATAS